MRTRLLAGLAVAVVLAIVSGSAYAVVRHRQAVPTVTCRDLLEPAQVHALAPTVARDLGDPAFGVDVEALALPAAGTVDDARHALQAEHAAHELGPGPEDALACATGSPGQLLLVRRADVPLEHCYGSAAMCAGQPTERRTCVDVYSVSGALGRHHDLGCPDVG